MPNIPDGRNLDRRGLSAGACRIAVHAVSGRSEQPQGDVPHDLDRARAMLDAGSCPAVGFAARAAPATAGTRPRRACRRPHVPAARRWENRVRHRQTSFGPGEPLALVASASKAPRSWPVIRTETSRFTPWPMLSWRRGPRRSRQALFRGQPHAAASTAGRCSRPLRRRFARLLTPANVDLTIVAARPKLGEAAAAMGKRSQPHSASMPPPSSQGIDRQPRRPRGAGRSISASAVVWVVPAANRGGEA